MGSQDPLLTLSKISFYQGRRDEIPNQELAKELAESRDMLGIQEIAEHLKDKNKNIQSDCLKVLYEIGYIAPDLIVNYAGDFLELLKNKNNRLVWGAMIGLATVADRCADEIWLDIDAVIRAVDGGSVITTVWGIKTLAKVAASRPARRAKIFPFLLQQIRTCLPRDVPLHAESMLIAVDESVRADFLAALATRQPELTPAQQARIKKLLKAY